MPSKTAKSYITSSGQVLVAETSSSEEERVVRNKKPIKYVSKFNYSSSESEDFSAIKKKKKVDSSEDEEEETPPSKPAPKAKSGKKASEPKINIHISDSEEEEEETPPVKVTKKRPHREENKSEPKSSSNKRKKEELIKNEDDFAEFREKLKQASGELLSDQELIAKTAKEEEKRYKISKKFVKTYEKARKIAKEALKPDWQKASKILTDAGALLAKYEALKKTQFTADCHLSHAIPKLGESGKRLYQQAMDIVSNLGPEDKAKFWEVQHRNRNAKCFEELVTIKEDEKQTIIASARSTPAIPAVISKLESLETNVDVIADDD